MAQNRGRAPVVIATIVFAVALSAGNLLCHVTTARDGTGPPLGITEPGGLGRLLGALGDAYALHPAELLFFAAAPLVAGLVLALWIGLDGKGSAAPTDGSVTAPPEGPPPSTGALRLLALLQQEGRLIDFLEEDIEGYGDAQVGAAVRDIHSRCRAALRERMKIERIYDQEDGSTVEIAPGFDPALVRLTGNVHGAPPFRGTLQHAGWRVRDVKLPPAEGLDASILAPAEIEIP